jgi:hypothetical protein
MSSQGSSTPVRSLAQILADTAKNKPDYFPVFFKRARSAYPSEIAHACIQYLGEQELDASGRQMMLWLAASPDYLDIILDQRSTKFETAQKLFVPFRQEDPQFLMKLFELADRQETLVENLLLRRALDILEAFDNLSLFVRWLQRLTYRRDERIRSKAAKLICGMGLNTALVERHLGSEDSRVRANTVEALWGTMTKEAEAIYLEALNDGCHRVVANAIVGLYPIDKVLAMETLKQLTEHSSPMFRLAMVWVIGKIGDGEGVELLQRLSRDHSPAVSKKAQTALIKFQDQEIAIAG